ncbi:MAG: phosphatase PAP2 family protein [Sphaerochaeta sp.]|uniref:phosphatase PAP2 family protein n=1 Tax=Sphaerochaeta sp. TaxID=1972642 RepID=UPI002979FA6B|nr:phosphatase PAP2 family protein [Sphaerochaeta sp.]
MRTYGVWAVMLLLLFLVLIALLLGVDVQTVGVEGTSLGLARMNSYLLDVFGFHPWWYALSEWLGVVSLLVVAGFGLLALTQLIRRRSLKRVDQSLYVLFALYGVLAFLYLFFEHVVLNYRPQSREPSFPSSHTLLVLFVMGSACVLLSRMMHKGWKRHLLQGLCLLGMALTVLGRLLSGVHWSTDILGAVFLSASLVFFFAAVVSKGGRR